VQWSLVVAFPHVALLVAGVGIRNTGAMKTLERNKSNLKLVVNAPKVNKHNATLEA